MQIRELQNTEWAPFFDAFSRTHKGIPVTVDVWRGLPRPSSVARGLPLVGIVIEPRTDTPQSVEIVAGGGDSNHVSHTVRRPARIRVAQANNGADDMLFIDSGDENKFTVIDFRSPAAESIDVSITELLQDDRNGKSLGAVPSSGTTPPRL